jgi:hypothetical protein
VTHLGLYLGAIPVVTITVLPFRFTIMRDRDCASMLDDVIIITPISAALVISFLIIPGIIYPYLFDSVSKEERAQSCISHARVPIRRV